MVNLVSRRPRERENEILLNATTLGGVDATGWVARPTAEWVLRASMGGGSYAPTPFNEETDETGLTRFAPLAGLRSESARGGVVDATFHRGRIEISGTVFASRVERAVQLRVTGPSRVAFENASEPTRTHGSELFVRYRHQGFLAMVTHAWTKSTEIDRHAQVRRDVPLTPRHYGSLNLIWEKEGVRGMLSNGAHHISFDEVIEAMRKTGADLNEACRETSLGGLAGLASSPPSLIGNEGA